MPACIRAPHPTDLPRLVALLAAAGLPVDDLATGQIDFLVAMEDGQLLGIIGGSGLGGRLLQAMEAHAAARGVRRLTLLTTTAAPFFQQRGYQPVPRADVAPAIQATAEFRSLCPASATCMHKHLAVD
jgi:GNAT superfamily N-acetyltransferase